MSKFHAIELAIELATRQRDEKARRHAQAQQAQMFAQGQLDQLQSYSADTDARWVGGQSLNMSVELVRHHYHFVGRLQHAVEHQGEVIAKLQRQLEAAHQQLLQAEYRLAGLRQVLQARKAEHLAVERRREQQITDEFAAMRHQRAQASPFMEEKL